MKFKKIVALLLAGALSASVLTGCGLNKNAVAATMEGEEVTLGLVNFIVRYQEAKYDDTYVQYWADPWNSDPYNSGTTLGDTQKESIMETLHAMYTLQAHMDDYDVSLSDEETAAITEAAEKFISDNSKETLEQMGATQEIVEEMLTLSTIQSKMYDAIIEGADTEVSDEEANMKGYTKLAIGISGYYDSSYSYIRYTDEEVEEAKANAAAILKAVQAGTELETAAEEYEYKTTYATYGEDTSMDDDLKAALEELAVGEVSDLIETDSYLYIVRLDTETDEEATESNRESIISDRQQEYYNEILEGWQENDGWTVNEKQLKKIKFHHLFTQVTETEEDTQGSESLEGTESVSK